ncbi:MAG: hypothetical protein H6591_09450 [Flavobacteriales bacterium]|nr:hypothetical protein [Flavobacteriales bacterium]
MRIPLLTLALFAFLPSSFAQLPPSCEPGNLPEWMQAIAWDKKPVPYALPKREPLHTNGFIGTWIIQKTNGDRFRFWSDKERVVVEVFGRTGERKQVQFLDLSANIRMKSVTEKGKVHFAVEDLHFPNVGYFYEIWSDSVRATGRTEQILDATCAEMLGTDGNNDTTYYWRTDKYPALFADMRVWAPWLCREGQMEYLTALCPKPVVGCLRAEWPKRRFGPEAGSIAFVNIAPGRSPMPTLEGERGLVVEQRFLWNNNSGIGTLPAWMRAYVSDLKPDTLPALFTPDPVDRGIPDNAFIGTLTAETPTMIIGMPDKRTGSDTTHQLAKYSYWADARRAVLIMDDPDDEGYLFYAVDLDADVVMATHNEMSGHVIPKLYINTLEEVGLKEFGRGLELYFSPHGTTRKINGYDCELFTTSERFLTYFWFPKTDVRNPVFDMKNWMVQRMGQKMKDLMFFGVAEKPMPMAVQGTTITSYKEGKAKPPVVDLRNYRVRDERLEQRRRRNEPPPMEVREVTVEEVMSGEFDVEAPVMVEAEPMEEMLPPVMEVSGASYDRLPRPVTLPPAIDSVMKATTNGFIGTARLRFTSTRGDKTTSWTVRYASTADKMVLIGQDEQPGSTEHTRAYVLDRATHQEKLFIPLAEGFRTYDQPLVAHPAPIFQPAATDSIIAGARKIVGRSAQHRLLEEPDRRRESWVDAKTPSLFHDVLGARRSWSGIEILLRGPVVASTRPGMPLEVTYTYKNEETLTLKVLELKPGAVDQRMFDITPDSWRR